MVPNCEEGNKEAAAGWLNSWINQSLLNAATMAGFCDETEINHVRTFPPSNGNYNLYKLIGVKKIG